MEERRKSPRFFTWNLAFIKRDLPLDIITAEPARVLNIGIKGCCLEKDDCDLKIGDKVEIKFIFFNTRTIKGTIKWITDGYIGIEFDQSHPEILKEAQEFRQAAIAGWKME